MPAAVVDHEVLVVGAGPAGAAAGITARRAGLDVLVVDKARFPRDKTCGDGLTAGALRAYERLGLDVPALPSYRRIEETVLVAPSGRSVALPLPTDGEHAAVVRRLELDDAFVRHARAEGVPVRDGVGIVGLRDDGDAVQVDLDDGSTCTVRWVVAADGHYSAVRRLHARTQSRRDGADLGTWHASRQYFHGVDEPRLFVLFDAALLPGYAWVFPLGDGRANVGVGVLRNRDGSASGRRLAAQWREVIAHPVVRAALGPRAEPEAQPRAWPIPGSYDPARLSSGRVLYAGDAAGVVDPMTGEGIAQALDTGYLAVGAIAREDSLHAVAARYRRDVGHALGTDLRFAGALQRLLGSPSGANAAIGAAGVTSWTRRNFARWMFEDYPRATILTPRRWRRGIFTAPGAYAASPEPAGSIPTLQAWRSPTTG